MYCNRSCLFVCVGWVCYQDSSNLRASILTKLGLLVKVVTIASWLNFGRPVPPGRYEAGWKFLAPPYYSQRTVFASPLSAFFIINFIRGHVFRTVYGLMLINWRERKHCRPINSAGFCTWSVSLPKPAGFLQLYTNPARSTYCMDRDQQLPWHLNIAPCTSILRTGSQINSLRSQKKVVLDHVKRKRRMEKLRCTEFQNIVKDTKVTTSIGGPKVEKLSPSNSLTGDCPPRCVLALCARRGYPRPTILLSRHFNLVYCSL